VSHFTRPAITLQGAHEVGPATPVVFRRRQNAKAAVGPIQFELFVQHARQQAGLNCIGFVLMVLRVGSELAPNGGPGLGVDQRPLGIAALEDKIVQRAMVEVLNAIYEEDFLGFSYGFRHYAHSRRLIRVLDKFRRDPISMLNHMGR
jgi:hypothetical protein